jgi:hypothetical protein
MPGITMRKGGRLEVELWPTEVRELHRGAPVVINMTERGRTERLSDHLHETTQITIRPRKPRATKETCCGTTKKTGRLHVSKVTLHTRKATIR